MTPSDHTQLGHGTGVAPPSGMRVLTLLAALALAGCPQQSADEAPPLEEPCDGAGPFFAADPDTGTCYGPYQDCLLIPDGWASCRPCATDVDCGDLAEFHCVEQDAEVGATTPAGGRCEPGPGGAPPPVA